MAAKRKRPKTPQRRWTGSRLAGSGDSDHHRVTGVFNRAVPDGRETGQVQSARLRYYNGYTNAKF